MILALRIAGVILFLAFSAILMGAIFCAISAGSEYSYLDLFNCTVLLGLMLWCATDETHTMLSGR